MAGTTSPEDRQQVALDLEAFDRDVYPLYAERGITRGEAFIAWSLYHLYLAVQDLTDSVTHIEMHVCQGAHEGDLDDDDEPEAWQEGDAPEDTPEE